MRLAPPKCPYLPKGGCPPHQLAEGGQVGRAGQQEGQELRDAGGQGVRGK